MSAPAPDPAPGLQAHIEEVVASHDPREAVRILRRQAERTDEWVVALLKVAGVYFLSDSIRAFCLAFLARRLTDDPARLGTASNVMGQVACMTGHHLGGLRRLDRAVRYFEEAGDQRAAHSVRMRSIHSLARLGSYDLARAVALEALAFFDSAGDDVHAGQTHVSLGGLCYRADKYREALGHYREARRLLGGRGTPEHTAAIDMNLGHCLAAVHRFRAAHRHYGRARTVFEDLGLHRTVADVECGAAYAHLLAGDFKAALDRFERALEIIRAERDTESLATILLDRAELFLQMGMSDAARGSAAEAAGILPPGQLHKERAQSNLFRAIAAVLEGKLAEAERALVEAKRAFLEEDNDVYGAQCDLLLGMVASRRGDHRYARRLAATAQRTLLAYGRVARAASADFFLAGLDIRAGAAGPALKRLERASVRIREARTPWSMVELLRLRGLALLALDKSREGVNALGKAVEVLERYRGRVPSDEFMVSFLASKASIYTELVSALARVGAAEAAFEYSERARSRALGDMLGARATARPMGAKASVSAERVRLLRTELNDTYTQLHGLSLDDAAPDPERVLALRARVHKLEGRLSERLRSGAGAPSLQAARAPALTEVQALLDEHTTLVEYFMTAEAVLAFVIRPDGIEMVELPMSRADIERCVRKFRFHMSAVGVPEPDDPKATARAVEKARANLGTLRAGVFDPLASMVSERTVVIVPHGVLHNVPFHAFPDGEGWLGERFDFVYAPSAGVYGHCARPTTRATGPATLLSLPDQLAPAIAAEREAVREVLGDEVQCFDGDAATWAKLRQAAGASRVLHIASHGMFRKQAPMLSSIRLADRWMNLYDLYDLDVRAELVVLSACETGAAHISAGDELIGLIRGFLYAGAPRLLLGQWRLHDQATALFMHSLYVGIRERRDYLAALRGAMGAVRERYPHPYFWAPFFLVGHPG